MELNMGLHGVSIWMALIFGFCLAALYDCFRILRITVYGRNSGNIFFDFFYMLFCGLVTYLLAIAVDFGRVRFFLLACEVIGACLYFFTIGAVTNRIAKALHRAFLWVKKWVFFLFVRPVRILLIKIGKLFFLLVKKVGNFLKKTVKKQKIP